MLPRRRRRYPHPRRRRRRRHLQPRSAHPVERPGAGHGNGHGMTTATAISSATFRTPSSAPSSPSYPPRTALACRPSPADGAPSGAQRLSTSTPRTSAPMISSSRAAAEGLDRRRNLSSPGILSEHPGPARRFDFRLTCIFPTKREYAKNVAQIESWFHSRSLDNLEELHIFFPILCGAAPYPLPTSVLRFTSTVVMATAGYCDVPDEIAPSLNFPILKHLTLRHVNISVDAFHGVLSACHVLETLSLLENVYNGSLHISSRNLRSICFSNCFMGKNELVIEDTPHLERLLCPCLDGETIRVNRAPKLEILGPLSPRISSIQIANLIFQGLVPTSFNNLICTVKVLALQFSCADLNAVLDVLRFFPCLEKLYVMWNKYLNTEMNNVRHYDPLDPIECLETHLKTLVLKNYKGDKQDVSFAKFFVLNAKVLNEIKFGVSAKFDEKWVADQHRLLGVESEASPDFEFKHCSYYLNRHSGTHDLSIADPFNNSFLAEDHTLPVISISCSSSSDEDSA